jgi:hypothetical protein
MDGLDYLFILIASVVAASIKGLTGISFLLFMGVVLLLNLAL